MIHKSAPSRTCADAATQTDFCHSTVVEEMVSLFNLLPESESFDVIGKLLQSIVLRQKLNIFIPEDFLSKSVTAMCNLSQCGRYNIIYGISKGIGTFRPDGSDTLIPIRKMPMGLLEYLTKFFISSHISQV